MKTCARCKEQKPLDQFNRKTETQLQSFCKPCNNVVGSLVIGSI